jgi:hypothetical protein
MGFKSLMAGMALAGGVLFASPAIATAHTTPGAQAAPALAASTQASPTPEVQSIPLPVAAAPASPGLLAVAS